VGTKVSKLTGCESFSTPPSDAAGMTEGIAFVGEAEDSMGMLYHLEYMRSVHGFQVQGRERDRLTMGLC